MRPLIKETEARCWDILLVTNGIEMPCEIDIDDEEYFGIKTDGEHSWVDLFLNWNATTHEVTAYYCFYNNNKFTSGDAVELTLDEKKVFKNIMELYLGKHGITLEEYWNLYGSREE